MNKKIEQLRDWGCDTAGALDRMLNDEEFYIECLNSVLNDNNFDDLITNLEINNTEKAFDAAHTLKGVLANLGLTPMYNIVVEIVASLRKGDNDNLIPKATEVLKLRDKLTEIMK